MGLESVLDFNLKKIFALGDQFSFNYFLNTSVINSKYTRTITNDGTNNFKKLLRDLFG